MAKRKAAEYPEKAANENPAVEISGEENGDGATETTPKNRQMEHERVMYVGPTVIGFGVQNRVYDRIPEEFRGRLEKTPELRNLFIPIEEYPNACRMLREKKGYIFNAYETALKIKNGGKSE